MDHRARPHQSRPPTLPSAGAHCCPRCRCLDVHSTPPPVIHGSRGTAVIFVQVPNRPWITGEALSTPPLRDPFRHRGPGPTDEGPPRKRCQRWCALPQAGTTTTNRLADGSERGQAEGPRGHEASELRGCRRRGVLARRPGSATTHRARAGAGAVRRAEQRRLEQWVSDVRVSTVSPRLRNGCRRAEAHRQGKDRLRRPLGSPAAGRPPVTASYLDRPEIRSNTRLSSKHGSSRWRAKRWMPRPGPRCVVVRKQRCSDVVGGDRYVGPQVVCPRPSGRSLPPTSLLHRPVVVQQPPASVDARKLQR